MEKLQKILSYRREDYANSNVKTCERYNCPQSVILAFLTILALRLSSRSKTSTHSSIARSVSKHSSSTWPKTVCLPSTAPHQRGIMVVVVKRRHRRPRQTEHLVSLGVVGDIHTRRAMQKGREGVLYVRHSVPSGSMTIMNCELLVCGPQLAILTTPYSRCVRVSKSSSANERP